MKLKMKVKTLILLIVSSLFLLLIVVPSANLTIATVLNDRGSEMADVFYKNYMASPVKLNERKALYDYGESLTRGLAKYKIKFSGWGGGEMTSPENMEKAMELFEEILLMDEEKNDKNGKIDEYSKKSYFKLLDTSIASLDMDKLLYWIEWGRENKNEEINYISKLYSAYSYFVEKDYKSSKEILEGLTEEEVEGDIKYYQLMGDVNLQLGDMEEAKKYYEAASKIDTYLRGFEYESYFGGSILYLDQYHVDNFTKKYQGDYKISGRVTNDEEGLPLVEVYISEDIGAFPMGGERADAITDENGDFEILGLKQGVYDIGIGIHPSQLYKKVFLRKDIWSVELNSDMEIDFEFVSPMEINEPKENLVIKDDGKLQISWDPVEGADHYKAEFIVFSDPKERVGNSSIMPLRDKNGQEKVKNNSIDLDIEKLDNRIYGLSWEGEEEIVNPSGILGFFIPDVEYPLIVNAYDKEGDIIGSSLTLISDYEDMVAIEIEGDLSEGENLILDMQYEEAIAHYEEKLIAKPQDKESLMYLTRIYSLGWKKGERDVGKALKYAKVYDSEYKDFNLSLEVVDFMNMDEMKENKEEVKEILEKTSEKDRDTSYYNQLASYYIIEEDYLKARESYEKMEDYKYVDMVYIDMYLEDYEKAIATLESEELISIKMNKTVAIEALKQIDSLSNEDRDLFKKLLKARLDNTLSRDEKGVLYRKTLKAINSLKLKDLLREIAREEYWDLDY